jgi:hypothetical protein
MKQVHLKGLNSERDGEFNIVVNELLKEGSQNDGSVNKSQSDDCDESIRPSGFNSPDVREYDEEMRMINNASSPLSPYKKRTPLDASRLDQSDRDV